MSKPDRDFGMECQHVQLLKAKNRCVPVHVHKSLGIVLHTSNIESSEGFLISPQILSRDSVTVDVDAVCYYKVFNPIVAIANVENFR